MPVLRRQCRHDTVVLQISLQPGTAGHDSRQERPGQGDRRDDGQTDEQIHPPTDRQDLSRTQHLGHRAQPSPPARSLRRQQRFLLQILNPLRRQQEQRDDHAGQDHTDRPARQHGQPHRDIQRHRQLPGVGHQLRQQGARGRRRFAAGFRVGFFEFRLASPQHPSSAEAASALPCHDPHVTRKGQRHEEDQDRIGRRGAPHGREQQAGTQDQSGQETDRRRIQFASQMIRQQRRSHRQHGRRDARRKFRNAEQPKHHQHAPVDQDRCLGLQFVIETRHDPVALAEHLGAAGGDPGLVVIEQGGATQLDQKHHGRGEEQQRLMTQQQLHA